MFDNHFTVIFWCLVISGSCFLIVYIINQIENENKEKVIKKKKLKILDKIYMETFIAGFDDMGAEEGMECWVSKDKFTFFFGALKDKGIDIKIKRITNVFLEDKTFVSQRLTATRILALGIFSLAVPKKKKHKEFCIIIEWEDSNREIQNDPGPVATPSRYGDRNWESDL